MGTPAETRDQLIDVLRDTRTKLMSPEWLTLIRAAPKTQRQAASDNLLKVQIALLDLENQKLATFRDDLAANEEALTESSEALRAALSSLQSVATVLAGLSSLLKVVARVVTLV